MALVDMCGGVHNLPQEEDQKMCQLVLQVFTHGAINETRRRFNSGELTEQQVRDHLALEIIDKAMKPLTNYLESRGFYYQINVQEGKVFIPNAPKSLTRNIFGAGIEGVIGEVSVLQKGQTFQQVLDFDGIKLY
ncbi:hypothetical protein HY483_02110 [Candidatus Woesearchaeota archaeon]|nr:hypothetical protein [Candidatus Woesearchaeota archaeon]